MGNLITYSVDNSVRIGVPFTWGGGTYWAIKVEDGGMFFLHNGERVTSTEWHMASVGGVTYAKSIEIK